MRAWVQRTARNYGFEIRKAPFPNFQSLPVFDLALQFLIAKRGEKLTFVEVGANDGKSTDPLYDYIMNRPWTGLLIEPQPDVFARLTKNYSGLEDRLRFENVAIAKDPGFLTLYRAPQTAASVGAATVVSFDPATTAKQLRIPESQLEKIMVPTARLDDVLSKHGMLHPDILQLDTEGLDWEVLQTMDLTKNRPLIIGFEHGHLSPASIGAMTKHLNDQGYFVHYGGYQSDSVAMRKDLLN